MIRAGLEALVRPLKLADEIKIATDCLEGAGGTFTADHLIALIQKRASEGLMLPSTKEVAAAAGYRHKTQCHQWLSKGVCSRGSNCSWAHDPNFKARTDLVPICARLATEGNCSRPQCYYKHPNDSGAAALPVTLPSQERAAAAVNATLAYDMAEIKTMLYGIIKDQAALKITITEQQALNTEQQARNTEQQEVITAQKAFITHMLAEDD